ncbi:oxidoreductase [Lithospermum erythrorhizon]|uniref:indole-3-acetaldehyde oxidase n=1 Tax=Lithospermum erythrorhizon TaxID=34254 RepID=A0AAV3NNJ1_LITER
MDQVKLITETRIEQLHGNLMFEVNGERFEVLSVDPCTTLLEFLRYQTRFKSVKLGCGEGGCGACVVLLTKYNPVVKKVESFTVSSCLTLLCSVNGGSITTSEGLGNSKDGFHSIHQRFSGFHASQCGFCTPGICISLFAALTNADKTDRSEPQAGLSKLTASEAEKAVAGNLCRCTGYRPIADACKSFAADVDMEDLGINCFWKKEEPTDMKLGRLPPYKSSDQICMHPDFLNKPMILNSETYSWHSPVTVQELVRVLNPSMKNDSAKVKLVVGNTAIGYHKDMEHYESYIDLRSIPELSMIEKDQTGLVIGAAVTISDLILNLRDEKNVSSQLCADDMIIFHQIADHMEKVASGFIRNSASIGGNLVMAQRNSFPSDIATVLLAVGSNVSIVTVEDQKVVTLEEFLMSPPLDHRSLLLSVKIPFWGMKRDGKSNGSDPKLLFQTYRAAPRPLGNALPYLNAAFWANISVCKTGVRVNDVRLVFGAFGTKHAVRARRVENYLGGKVLSASVLYEAVKLVKEAVVPEHGTSYPSYRSSLACSFLFEFFHPFINVPTPILEGSCESLMSSFLEIVPKSGSDRSVKSTLLSSSKQEIESINEYYPVGEPMPKVGASLQASGEAVYADDIPSPPGCLYGAFIYSKRSLSRIRSVNFKTNSYPEGVTAVVTFKDIPAGGENIGSKTYFGIEQLFADEVTRHAGERIAVVVAKTQRCADRAADMALIDYGNDNLGPPILTVEEAVERSSFFNTPPFLTPKPVGDFSKGMAEADHKILSAKLKLGSQYYFYMETQTALAVPDEDNCIVVYSSIQVPEFAQIVIARCLGIPEHNVRVVTRRVGGGFGGKALKAMPIAAACALAAHNLHKPVRMYLNRKTDMIMAGGRHPMKITYSVGFKSSGRITALNLDILIDAGISEDVSPVMPSNLLGAFKKYDWGALSFDIKVCKTNNISRSAMRGPGEVQGSYIAEAIIEHVASTLHIDVDSVRDKNLHTFESLNTFYAHSAGDNAEYTLPVIWDKLANSSRFFERIQMIERFNQKNKWRKRGISRVPILHEVTLRPTPGKVSILWDGSVVVEVGGIELGQGLWTKVKQMTAYALSSVQCDGMRDLVDKIRIVQADTLSLVQGGFTAGSTTSESSCEAVQLCCNILVERLAPLKKQIQEDHGHVKWENLILQAHYTSVNLSASSYYVPDRSSMQYLNYGAAVGEVEINVLTGETKILQADIIYDCGQSMNPAVDLGQIEGAFVQGIGFFMLEEYLTDKNGLVTTDSTWTYKIPTIDTIPKQFNVEIVNSGHHQKRVLSSKASGEPPLLLAVSIHCATRAAIKEARKQATSWSNASGETDLDFELEVPATMPIVKTLCGLDNVEKYLESLLNEQAK